MGLFFFKSTNAVVDADYGSASALSLNDTNLAFVFVCSLFDCRITMIYKGTFILGR